MEQPPGVANNEALDARWYNRFKDLYFEDFEKLSGSKESRELEKAAFLSGNKENPTLDYPQLETFDFDYTEAALLNLKLDLLEQEKNSVVAKIYRARINEHIATVRMLRAAQSADDRKFARYSEFVHGKPQEENMAYVLEAIRFDISNSKSEPDTVRAEAQARILALLPDTEETETIPGASRDILPPGVKIPGTVESAEEASTLFAEVLNDLKIDDWKVVIDTEKGISGFSVSQEHKEIRIPSDEKLAERKITKRKVAALIEHEIKTHVVRRENGERSKLQLLGLGLDRYVRGEEGVAMYAEQHITGAKEFAGIPTYFSTMVAKGLGGLGGEARDFRQTFSVLHDYRLATLKNGDDIVERANNAAWIDCVRIFRGTTGTTPGAVYTKDLAYMGNSDVWTLVAEDSDAVLTFSIGKFDPTNTRHVALLTELGIIDTDLQTLE